MGLSKEENTSPSFLSKSTGEVRILNRAVCIQMFLQDLFSCLHKEYTMSPLLPGPLVWCYNSQNLNPGNSRPLLKTDLMMDTIRQIQVTMCLRRSSRQLP